MKVGVGGERAFLALPNNRGIETTTRNEQMHIKKFCLLLQSIIIKYFWTYDRYKKAMVSVKFVAVKGSPGASLACRLVTGAITFLYAPLVG